MENNKKNSEPTPENTNADYNPTARDFQRTEEDTDNISGSEKEASDDKKKQTERANTTPDKNKIN